MVAVCSNIESLHRMTREERDLAGLMVAGSDHLTAYNVYAEAVNQHGYLGEVYGLPRHLFEEGVDEWAERRGVLVKVDRGRCARHGVGLPRARAALARAASLSPRRDLQQRFVDLLARIMPFDLVIDEHTADGQEARVSRGSMAGSWGAVAGNLRFFADRFGVSRAGIEGTTIPFDLVRRFASRGAPLVELGGSRRDQHLVVTRRLDYFGFELEQVHEPLQGPVPSELLGPLREGLAAAIMAGSTIHPDQGRIRRTLEELGELWRRSGGSLDPIEPGALRGSILQQLSGVTDWQSFLGTRLLLDAAALVPAETRASLLDLPSMARLHGDAVPLDYDVEGGMGVVRLRLREGQARRLRERDLPALDRPVRFTIVRGRHPAVHAGSIEELRTQLQALPRGERHGRARPHRRRRG